MKYEIETHPVPLLHITLSDGQSVYTTDVSAAWLSTNFDIKSGPRGAIGSRMTGDSVSATTYTCTSGMGTITFSGGAPGVFVEQSLKPTGSIIVQQGAFFVADESVKVTGVKGKKLEGSSLYGREGFVIQRFGGPGTLFAYALGGLVERKLDAREELWVEPGHIVMYEASIALEVTPARSANNLTRSDTDRLHHAVLKGPGTVWLQHSTRAILGGLANKYT